MQSCKKPEPEIADQNCLSKKNWVWGLEKCGSLDRAFDASVIYLPYFRALHQLESEQLTSFLGNCSSILLLEYLLTMELALLSSSATIAVTNSLNPIVEYSIGYLDPGQHRSKQGIRIVSMYNRPFIAILQPSLRPTSPFLLPFFLHPAYLPSIFSGTRPVPSLQQCHPLPESSPQYF